MTEQTFATRTCRWVMDGLSQTIDKKTKNTDGLIAQTYKFIQIIWHKKFKNMLNADCFYYKQANFTIEISLLEIFFINKNLIKLGLSLGGNFCCSATFNIKLKINHTQYDLVFSMDGCLMSCYVVAIVISTLHCTVPKK